MRRLLALCGCALWAVVAAAPAPVPAAAATAAASTSAHHHQLRGDIGSVLGGIVVVGALLLWSFGYGLLGGRITPLSTRLPRERG